MLEFLLHLLKAKLVVLGTANIPVLAALLVLGTTGFVVTGTIEVNGDEDDDRRVDLVVKPLESKTCLDALIGQTETLLELDVLAADANGQLRHLRERARHEARDLHRTIDEKALRAQMAASSDQIRAALTAARKQVLDAKDLSKCQDLDPNTTVDVDVAALRATYDAILTSFTHTLNGILDQAQAAFDQLVATAPQRKGGDCEDEHEGGHGDDDMEGCDDD